MDEVIHKALQLGSSELNGEMLRAILICGNEWKIHVGLNRTGQFDLGAFASILQALEREAILPKVNAGTFRNSSAR